MIRNKNEATAFKYANLLVYYYAYRSAYETRPLSFSLKISLFLLFLVFLNKAQEAPIISEWIIQGAFIGMVAYFFYHVVRTYWKTMKGLKSLFPRLVSVFVGEEPLSADAFRIDEPDPRIKILIQFSAFKFSSHFWNRAGNVKWQERTEEYVREASSLWPEAFEASRIPSRLQSFIRWLFK